MFLYQPQKGYCYNSDSIFLVDFIRQFKPKGKLLDVGCGVGILSLLLGRDFPIEVYGVEKQPNILEYAKYNFKINSIDLKAYEGDFLQLDIQERFDYIISNPPFYNEGVTESNQESLNISRYAKHLPLKPFIQKVKRLLKPRGYFIFCYEAKQSDRVLYELKAQKLNPETIQFIHPKIDREAKIVMVEARANSRSMCKILPPLITFNEEGEYTAQSAKAFVLANTHSIKGDRF